MNCPNPNCRKKPKIKEEGKYGTIYECECGEEFFIPKSEVSDSYQEIPFE